MMQALVEIMYERGPDGSPIEVARECVQPEFWKMDLGRVYLKEAAPSTCWLDCSLAMALLGTPKFALVPIEEARSLNAFHGAARRLIERNANLSQCLYMWVGGQCSLVEALRGACWANLEGIAKAQEIAPFWCEPLSLEAETIEQWLGRVAECVLAFHDVLARYGRWLELQNPQPIEVNGTTLVYQPRPEMEAYRLSELAKIKMMTT